MTYDGDLRATVPLFASAIEQAAAGAVRSALEVEQEVAREWLADHADGTLTAADGRDGHGQAPQP